MPSLTSVSIDTTNANKVLKISIITLSLLLFGCSNVDKNDASDSGVNAHPTANIDYVLADSAALSSDEMQGRKAGTEGYKRAAQLVAARFDNLGLAPITPNYRQQVSLREASLNLESTSMSITLGDHSVALVAFEDYLVGPTRGIQHIDISGDLVFVGSALVAPSFNVDDLSGVDLKGKVAVVFAGVPKAWPSEERAHLASRARQRDLVQQAGAVGIVYLSSPKRQRLFEEGRAKRSASRSLTYWLDRFGQPFAGKGTIATAMLSPAQSDVVVKAMGVTDLESFYGAIHTGNDNRYKGASVGTISWQSESTFNDYQSANVLGFLEGRDPSLSPVVLTAHLDHLGVGKEGEIYNGAMDNASGVSVMLEVARMFQQLPKRPRRSIIFAALTAEEMGLLGAEYFVANRPYEARQIAANLNIDMPILTYESSDVLAFGSAHSDLESLVARGLKRASISLERTDPWPQMSLFLRSDHYPFVKAGIPSTFLVTGHTAVNPEIDGKAEAEKFLKDHYHSTSDEGIESWNRQAVYNFTQANFEIARAITNEKRAPKWKKSSLFYSPVSSK